MLTLPWDTKPDPVVSAYLTHMPRMVTTPRNVLTLGTKCLSNDLYSEPKWSQFDFKNRSKTDFKANMQNITKHHYLLCSVNVSHLKKHTFYDLWAPKSRTK